MSWNGYQEIQIMLKNIPDRKNALDRQITKDNLVGYNVAVLK